MATGDRIKIMGGIDWRDYTQFTAYTSGPKASGSELINIQGSGFFTHAIIYISGTGGNNANIEIIVDGNPLFKANPRLTRGGITGIVSESVVSYSKTLVPDYNLDVKYGYTNLPVNDMTNNSNNICHISTLPVFFESSLIVKFDTSSSDIKGFCKGGIK